MASGGSKLTDALPEPGVSAWPGKPEPLSSRWDDSAWAGIPAVLRVASWFSPSVLRLRPDHDFGGGKIHPRLFLGSH